VFFLSLAVLASLIIPLWVTLVTGRISLPLAMPAPYWHQHEMLFGFLSAAIAGFLLTAVCVWTGTERTHGTRLLLLWLIWLAGRILLVAGGQLPESLVQMVNLAFLPLVMLDAGWRIRRARQLRQLVLLVVLGLLWLMQVGFVTTLDTRFSHGALVVALALIGVIGGRITPTFSAAWLRQQGLDSRVVRVMPRLDMASLASLVALTAALVAGVDPLSGLLALFAGALILARLAGWQGWRFRSEPLLWILHLSILWMPIALFLLAGTLLAGWPSTAWIHAAGTGAIGSLILGVIARVSLGHTGRPLVLPRGMVAAFILIHLAALVRVLTALEIIPWHPGVGSSSLLWMLAYAIFLIRYGNILASPRADQKPG
jgi:uncharacterized protein involved in response to NO